MPVQGPHDASAPEQLLASFHPQYVTYVEFTGSGTVTGTYEWPENKRGEVIPYSPSGRSAYYWPCAVATTYRSSYSGGNVFPCESSTLTLSRHVQGDLYVGRYKQNPVYVASGSGTDICGPFDCLTYAGSHTINVRRVPAEITVEQLPSGAISPGTAVFFAVDRIPAISPIGRVVERGWIVRQGTGTSRDITCSMYFSPLPGCTFTPTQADTGTYAVHIEAVINGELQEYTGELVVHAGTARLVLDVDRSVVDAGEPVTFTARAEPEIINGQPVSVAVTGWAWGVGTTMARRAAAPGLMVALTGGSNSACAAGVNSCVSTVNVSDVMTVTGTVNGQPAEPASVAVAVRDSCAPDDALLRHQQLRDQLRDAMDSTAALDPPKERSFVVYELPGNPEPIVEMLPLHPQATNCMTIIVPEFPGGATPLAVGHTHPYRPRQPVTCTGETRRTRAAFGAGDADWPAINRTNKQLTNLGYAPIPMIIIDPVNVYMLRPGEKPRDERRSKLKGNKPRNMWQWENRCGCRQ